MRVSLGLGVGATAIEAAGPSAVPWVACWSSVDPVCERTVCSVPPGGGARRGSYLAAGRAAGSGWQPVGRRIVRRSPVARAGRWGARG